LKRVRSAELLTPEGNIMQSMALQSNVLRRLAPVKGIRIEMQKLARFLRNPMKRIRHRAALREIVRRPGLSGLLDERTGYGFIPRGTLPSLDKAVQFCREVLEERRNKPELWPIPASKHHNYPIPILQPTEYGEAPAIFDLVLSDQVLQIVSEYFGEIPILQRINIWWTPQNAETRGSQFYHRDTMSWSERQAKFFINITDVGPDEGPFTFLPANISDKIVRKFGYPPDRVTDEVIFETASPSDQVAVVGPPGTACVLDSSRCLHYGSRCVGGERLVLMFNFRPYLSPDRSPSIRSVSKEFAGRLRADPVRRLAFPVNSRE
jgi:hypothetical protein